MKQILQKISILSISILVSIGAAKAQTTIFLQDGANDEFVNSQWDFGACGFCMVNTDKVSIQGGEAGTLTINNSNKYKNISIELRFDHPTNNATFTFDLTIENAVGSAQTEYNIYGDATTGNQYAFAIKDFNNPTGFELKKMTFSNPSKNLNITYIKITGEQTVSIDNEELDAFDVKVGTDYLTIDSKTNGTLNIYNSLGQIEGTYSITAGENIIPNTTQGLLFLSLTNSENEMITRKKIMR